MEAPLSEDLFLKRIVWYFDREKVTNVVQRAYEQQMYGYQRYGIIRRNGFLYLDNGKEIQFRGPGDVERDIKQIAPEELAGVTARLSGFWNAGSTRDARSTSRPTPTPSGTRSSGKLPLRNEPSFPTPMNALLTMMCLKRCRKSASNGTG